MKTFKAGYILHQVHTHPDFECDPSVTAFDAAHGDKITKVITSKAVANVQPLKPELNSPYTLAQVIGNLALIHCSQDLTWCRWVAHDILERGIERKETHE